MRLTSLLVLPVLVLVDWRVGERAEGGTELSEGEEEQEEEEEVGEGGGGGGREW